MESGSAPEKTPLTGVSLPTTQEIQEPAPSRGVWYRAEESKRYKHFISIWLPLIGYLALSCVITAFVAIGVNGCHALAYDDQSRSQPGGKYVFRVSDITTLLSAATTILDLVGETWTGLVGWRCALALMEKDGLSIRDISKVIGSLPWWKRPRGHEWLVALILLLLFPHAFIEPLFSGSVNWSFSVDYAPATIVASGYGTASASLWYWYLAQGTDRKSAVRRAGGIASSTWDAEDSQQAAGGSLNVPGGLACRHLMSSVASVNSTLGNATIPCIYIQNITWYDYNDVGVVWDYAGSKGSDLSIIGDSPFSYYSSGVSALFVPGDDWNTSSTVEMDSNTSTAAFPATTKWNGNMTILLLVDRQNATGCKPISGGAFGNSSYLTDSIPGVFQAVANAYNENCMAWGTVYFTAGVVDAPTSTYVTSQVVEYFPAAPDDDGNITAAQQAEILEAIKPSIWTREALWLMPDAMAQIAIMNSSLLPTWENLDNYTATLIRYAYMSNWDMLHSSYQEDDRKLTLYPAEPRLRASVSFQRLFAWFGASLLLPLTGVIFKLLHRSCHRAIIEDPVAILLTDSSEVVKDYNGLTGMMGVTKEDPVMKVHLRQVEPDVLYFKLAFDD